MTGVRATDLAGLELFAGADPADLEALAADLRRVEAQPGDVLVHEGDPAHSFLVIVRGAADVSRTRRDGERFVARLAPGMIAGELALLRHTPRVATVTVVEPLTGYVGDEAAFARLLEVPGVAERLARTARQRVAGLLRPVPVALRDGAQVLLRPVLPGDRERAAESLEGFSTDTLYRRFMSGRKLTTRAWQYLLEVDYVDHFVWIVVDADRGVGVGDARYIRAADDRAQAEIAFTVSDAFQGRGVGTLLFGALAAAAHEGGVERFEARVLVDNRPMRRLIDRTGAQWRVEEPGVVHTVVEVPDPGLFLPDGDLEARLRESARTVLHGAG